jgi:hypothetical protein
MQRGCRPGERAAALHADLSRGVLRAGDWPLFCAQPLRVARGSCCLVAGVKGHSFHKFTERHPYTKEHFSVRIGFVPADS